MHFVHVVWSKQISIENQRFCTWPGCQFERHEIDSTWNISDEKAVLLDVKETQRNSFPSVVSANFLNVVARNVSSFSVESTSPPERKTTRFVQDGYSVVC